MPDISKCANSNKCPVQSKCVRVIAPSSDYQSYSNFEPSKGFKCTGFMDTAKYYNNGCKK